MVFYLFRSHYFSIFKIKHTNCGHFLISVLIRTGAGRKYTWKMYYWLSTLLHITMYKAWLEGKVKLGIAFMLTHNTNMHKIYSERKVIQSQQTINFMFSKPLFTCPTANVGQEEFTDYNT